MTKLVLLDLDGTLADYDAAMISGLASLMSSEEVFIDRSGIGFQRDIVPTYMQERERMVRSMPGFYRHLKPIPLGFFVYSVLRDLGYNFHVASKAPRHNTAIASMEKIQWCEEYLPGIPVTISGDKSILRGDILFDDWPGYIEPWLQANSNGLAIVPDSPWNKKFHHSRILKVSVNTIQAEIITAIANHESNHLV